MKIYIIKGLGGGSKKFLDHFSEYLNQHECWDIVEENADVVFFNSWSQKPLEALEIMKKNPYALITHRVDGSATLYGREDNSDEIQSQISSYADLTIFQSIFSKKCTQERNIIRHDGPVVYNPVEVNENARVKPWSTEQKLKVVVLSHSNNRKKGIWRLPDIARTFQDIEIHLIGPFKNIIKQMDNLFVHGALEREGVASYLAKNHVYLSLTEDDTCPNVILEAMAAGLPIAYLNSGGVPELVGPCGRAVTGDEVDLGDILKELAVSDLGQKAVERCRVEFSPEKIFGEYEKHVSMLAELSRKKRMTTRFKRLWWAFKRRLCGGV